MLPWLGCSIQDIETANAVLVAGSNLRKEAPIIAHRVRKAALAGAKVSIANVDEYEFYFDTYEHVHGLGLVRQLAGIVVAATGAGKLPATVAALCQGSEPTAEQQRIASSLSEADQALVLIGLIAGRHKAAAAVRALAAALGELTGATFGTLSEGANSAGGYLAGVLPHRSRGGERRGNPGLHAGAMLAAPLDATLLFALEPADLTCIEDAAVRLAGHRFVAALTAYRSDALESAANLMLPLGTFAETSGTYINCEARWQSFAGIANPVGAARPGWKVLRVLGNLLEADGFDYMSSEQIRDEFTALVGSCTPDNAYRGTSAVAAVNGADAPGSDIDVPIYQVDPVVRRAAALQLTPEAKRVAGEQP